MVISFNIGNFSQPKISKIIIHATKKKTYQTLKKNVWHHFKQKQDTKIMILLNGSFFIYLDP